MADYTVDIEVASADYAFFVAVELGGEGTAVPEGTTVVLRFRWLERYTVWALTIETPDGEALSAQALCREGGFVAFDNTAAGAPVGRLQWRGRDTLVKGDLGTRLLLVWSEP